MFALSNARDYSFSKAPYLEREEKITDQSKHEARKFWSAETTCEFMHNYSHTRLVTNSHSHKSHLMPFDR